MDPCGCGAGQGGPIWGAHCPWVFDPVADHTFFEQALEVVQVRMGVNYGLNKVRFVAPVPVNSALRAHLKLVKIEPIDNNGMQSTWEVSIERQGSVKPVCVAESLVRQYP